MKKIALIIALISAKGLFAQCAGVTTCTLGALDNTTVQNALNSINKDNTLVILPSGSATWTSAVTYNQSFSTTIQGQTSCTATGTQTPTCTDNTTITGAQWFFVINTAANKLMRITGITFQINDAPNDFNGLLKILGPTTSLRLDHNHFFHMQTVAWIDGPLGVADHNWFDFSTTHTSFNGLRLKQAAWNGFQWGDGSWADNANFGTSKFFFLEDNTITRGFANDCDTGARFVMRHNYFANGVLQGHEMQSRNSGCRAMEVYQNTFFNDGTATPDDDANAILIRTGTGLYWGNTLTGSTAYGSFIQANNDRSNTQHGWTPTGFTACNAAGGSFNCYGYACNDGGTVGTVCDGTVTSLPNSPSGFDGNTDAFGYPAYEQVGRGKGDLLPQFDFTSNSFWAAGEPAWPHQQAEPLYIWLNTLGSTPVLGSGSPNYGVVINQNRDWYTDAGGSTGVQSGTSVPGSCTGKQAFWNTSTSTLFQCNGTNFVSFYTPFAYPHPLTQNPGWAYVQDSIDTFCTTGSSSCTIQTGTFIPTTPGTIWIVELTTNNTSPGVTIQTVTGGGGTWKLCPASICHISASSPTRNLDFAYNLTGTGGTTSITVNLSGPSVGQFGLNFIEIMPPPGFTAIFDTAATTSTASCTTCTGANLGTLAGTDVIVQNVAGTSPTAWNSWSVPYYTLPLGEGISINTTSGAAPTVVTNGAGAVFSAIAFTSTAGIFPPPAPTITVVNYTHFEGKSCNPSCSLAIPSTTAGNLLYVESGTLNGTHITGITGGGTPWVIPSGANTCQITLGGSDALSCAYILSAAGGAASLNVTMSGNSTMAFAVWEVNTVGAPWATDGQNSATNAASFTPKGITLNLNGTNDIIFQAAFVPGGTSSVSLYPMPRVIGVSGNGQGTMFFNNEAAVAARPNTVDGTAPTWVNQQNSATTVSALAFSSGPGTSPPPGVSFTPSTINFGSIPVGSAASPQSVTLTNTGLGTLIISSMSLGSPFTFSTSPVTNCGGTLAPAATCTITFNFTPVSPITSNATFSMVSNSLTSPDTISVTGTGTATPAPAVPMFAMAVFQ